jgi:hypothetical protein
MMRFSFSGLIRNQSFWFRKQMYQEIETIVDRSGL